MVDNNEVQGEHRDLTNRELKGVTARLLWAILISTITVVGGGLKVYYTAMEAIKENRDAIHELHVVIDNLQEQVNEVKLKLHDHDTQFGKVDDRFYNLKTSHK